MNKGMVVFVVVLVVGTAIAAVPFLGAPLASRKMEGGLAVENVYIQPFPFEPVMQIEVSYRMTVVEVTFVQVNVYEIEGVAVGALCASCVLAIKSTTPLVEVERDMELLYVPRPGWYQVSLSSERTSYIDVEISQPGRPGILIGGVLMLAGLIGICVVRRRQ
jgi:hypothetical protein